MNRRNFLKRAAAAGGAWLPLQAAPVGNRLAQIRMVGRADNLWTYQVKASGREHSFGAPSFEIDGRRQTAVLSVIRPAGSPARLPNGTTEYRYEGVFAEDPSLSLELIFRMAEDNPVVRYAYILKSSKSRRLTRSAGRDNLSYLYVSFAHLPQVKEVRFAEFNQMVHSYCLSERVLDERQFEDELPVMGPMLVGREGRHAFLVAYEHGSQVPDAFLQFQLAKDRRMTLEAVKGNYLPGESLDAKHPYQTVWMQAAAEDSGEDSLAAAYRTFVRKYLCLQPETRKSHVYYNTWNFQERNKWWNGKPYLASMNQERILAEIDVAHRMGIDVYVLDTGWYEKTGDWSVSRRRFPDGLKAVKARLDSYGMKLGLWFGPTSAAVSSRILREHRNCVMSWKGEESKPRPVWETEESYRMCLVSPYSDAFAERLIQLSKELGVTYFKWDAVGQYGCDAPGHWHGNAGATREERADSYAFQLPRQMTRIVEKLVTACPEAIVDFDVTESHRAVGLSFLSAGRYFLINNGPYYQNYDVPINPKTQNWNLFFHKGPARTWICRTPLTLDKWIPSILFLTHYFPDDPYDSQIVNIASLILGQNGIWGDLPAISNEGVALFGKLLGLYKQVGQAITESSPLASGTPGGSPEIHEKIFGGRGAVSVFATASGKYTYVTKRPVARNHWATHGASVQFDARGRARISLDFAKPGAHIVFFGVKA